MLVDKYSTVKYYMHDADFMLETFGTTEPSMQEKANKFFEMWLEWHENRLNLPPDNTNKKHILKALNNMGLIEYRDFQLKYNQLRFKSVDDLAFAQLCIKEMSHV